MFGSQDGGRAPAFPVAWSLGSEIGSWAGALPPPLGNVSTGHSDKACWREGRSGGGAGAGALAGITAGEKEFEKQISKKQDREGSVCLSL